MRMKTTLMPLVGLLALTMMLAGCDASSAATTDSTTPTGTAPTATAATTATGDLPIATTTATVSGASKTILTTAGGLTLYYRTSDSGTNVYVGASWPPLVAASGAPTSSTSLAGTLAVLNDGNGAQVTYNGHPLYRYAGDSKAGDTNGDGIGNVWFAVTPDLAKAASSAAGATPTPSGGYSYGG